MDSYAYQYPRPFPPMRPPEGVYPDHGDGFGEYYGMSTLNDGRDLGRRQSRSTNRTRKRLGDRSRSRSVSAERTRTRSKSHSRSRTPSRSRSRSHSRSHSRSRSGSRQREQISQEPGFLDAFRVLYLTPSKHRKSTSKYLVTKKRQDRIQEILKSDGLGSKRWLFYPRLQNPKTTESEPVGEVAGPRENCDQRVKIDGEFFRKYKRRSKVDSDAPIAKLKRWELILYKKLGFIQAI